MTAQRYNHQTVHNEKYEKSRLNADKFFNHIDSAASQECYAVFMCSWKSHHVNSLQSADRDKSCSLLQNEQISMCECFIMSDEWFEMTQWSELCFVVVNKSEISIEVKINFLK